MAEEEIIDSGFSAAVTLRPNKQRGKNLSISLWLSLGASALVIISLLLTFFILSRGFSGYDAHFELFETYYMFSTIAGIFTVAVNIVNIVFWILWMRRAFFNLHALGVPKLQYSEGMAAGGWFIPFFGLWIPAQIMNSVWKHTQELVIDNKRLVKNGAAVGIWWTLFLLDRFSKSALNIMNRANEASYQIQDNTTMYEVLKGETIIELVIMLCITVPLTFAAISMVKKSNKMQNLLYRKEQGEEITSEMIAGP